MREAVVVLAVFALLSSATALPASTNKQIDDGIEFVDPKNAYGDQPIVDTSAAGFDEGGYPNPFGGLFENLENLMIRVRQQMNDLLNRFPGIGGGNASSADGFPDFPSIPSIGSFPKVDIDLGKGNTTSVTKIIDGHKVVINQTEYHKDDENGTAFFKVRIIDVHPQNEETTAAAAAAGKEDAEEVTPDAAARDRESLENTLENEIIKNKEDFDRFDHRQQSIETFDAPDYSRFDIDPIEDNSIDYKPIDLSRDVYVNRLLAESGATTNPDAELIEFRPINENSAPKPLQTVRKSDGDSINLLDSESKSKPIDLSRDTYVNELLAKSGATVNPDAEIIDIIPKYSNVLPMEKYHYTKVRK